jgi:hypothetical protein
LATTSSLEQLVLGSTTMSSSGLIMESGVLAAMILDRSVSIETEQLVIFGGVLPTQRATRLPVQKRLSKTPDELDAPVAALCSRPTKCRPSSPPEFPCSATDGVGSDGCDGCFEKFFRCHGLDAGLDCNFQCFEENLCVHLTTRRLDAFDVFSRRPPSNPTT